MRPGTFNGIGNYIYIFSNEYFLKALLNTLIILIGSIIVLLPLSFFLGLFLYTSLKGSELFKLISFIPNILSGVMVGLIWTFILDPGYGLINSFLNAVGLHSLTQKWIGGVTLTPYSVVVVGSWQAVGFYAILFMAGLKMLPKDTFEAAIIDGATRFQRTMFVTLPLLKETIKMCTVMILIGAINTFQTVWILTAGGPNMQSHSLATLIYFKEFRDYDFGLGSAMAVVMLIAVMGLSIAFLNFTQKKVEE